MVGSAARARVSKFGVLHLRRGNRPNLETLYQIVVSWERAMSLEQAIQVQAFLEQVVPHLSHRDEPEQLALMLARLKKVREHIASLTMAKSGAR